MNKFDFPPSVGSGQVSAVLMIVSQNFAAICFMQDSRVAVQKFSVFLAEVEEEVDLPVEEVGVDGLLGGPVLNSLSRVRPAIE